MSVECRVSLTRGVFSLDLNVSLQAQGITAVFGKSGSGKTTLLRILAGLQKCNNATIKVGETIWQEGKYSLPVHKRPLAYVFQEPSLFEHLSVQKNLEYGIKRLKYSVDSSLSSKKTLDEAVQLMGIESLLARSPHQLSVGEQQRVAIARALAMTPELLLMDEPLSALDHERKQEILPYLDRLQQRLAIPIIYVSHAIDEVARLADEVVLLEQGRVVAQGAVSDVFTRLDLNLAHNIDAKSVIEAQVSHYDAQYGLNYLKFNGGQFAIARESMPKGSKVRLQIAARDVSLTLARQQETSILNILPATIDTLFDESDSQVTVKLVLGDQVLLARLTRKSAVDLNLQKGLSVFVQVKSVSVL